MQYYSNSTSTASTSPLHFLRPCWFPAPVLNSAIELPEWVSGALWYQLWNAPQNHCTLHDTTTGHNVCLSRTNINFLRARPNYSLTPGVRLADSNTMKRKNGNCDCLWRCWIFFLTAGDTIGLMIGCGFIFVLQMASILPKKGQPQLWTESRYRNRNRTCMQLNAVERYNSI